MPNKIMTTQGKKYRKNTNNNIMRFTEKIKRVNLANHLNRDASACLAKNQQVYPVCIKSFPTELGHGNA